MAKPKVVKKTKAKASAAARGAKGVRSAKGKVKVKKKVKVKEKPKAPAARAKAAAPRSPAPANTVAATSAPVPRAPGPAASPHDEASPPRDIPRLTRYGERFGAHKIDTRMLPQLLPIGSNALALFDPGAPESWRVLDRPVSAANSRVMLSVSRPVADGSPGARGDDRERAAALVVYVGHSQIARWTPAHHRDQDPPRSAEELPRCTVTSGWLAVVDAGDGPPDPLEVPAPAAGVAPVELSLPDGRRAIAVPCGKGEYAAYWAVDAADKAVCLVIDFDVFTQKEWKAKPA